MNIVLMTNTYKPIVGGLEKSIETFAEEFKKIGHRVLIVAPEFKGYPCCRERGIFRLPAIRNFKGTGFSIELPVPSKLSEVIKRFKPDIIHSQHPFLVGDTALRIAAQFNKPLIFTYHTLYGKEMDYFLSGSKTFTHFVIKLSIGYANLCDRVIAPSRSMAEILRKRGVRKQIAVVPTGIHNEDFMSGDGMVFRKFFGIPKDAFVVGSVSRLVPEKNVLFLARAVTAFLKKNRRAYFVIVGQGSLLEPVREVLQRAGIMERVVLAGLLTGKKLFHAYAAMDVFAFASHSETQGIILAEAMAAGKPVVAVNAPAVSEVIKNKKNGIIVHKDNISQFSDALSWVANRSAKEISALSNCAVKTAQCFSVSRSVEKMLKVYEEAGKSKHSLIDLERPWRKTIRIIKAQTSLLFNTARSTVSAITGQKIP